jgi:hypothetical protein
MKVITGAGETVLALDAQSEVSANGTDFQQGEHTFGTPSMVSTSDDGACPRQHAPSASSAPFNKLNPFPRGRWTASAAFVDAQPMALANLAEAPLQTLFWSPPETSMVEDATQRIAALLHSAVNAVQEIQLFDDLYEVPA